MSKDIFINLLVPLDVGCDWALSSWENICINSCPYITEYIENCNITFRLEYSLEDSYVKSYNNSPRNSN